jgi:hypothetical protein
LRREAVKALKASIILATEAKDQATITKAAYALLAIASSLARESTLSMPDERADDAQLVRVIADE